MHAHLSESERHNAAAHLEFLVGLAQLHAVLGEDAPIVVVELVEDGGLGHLQLDFGLAVGFVEDFDCDLICAMLFGHLQRLHLDPVNLLHLFL